MTPTYQFQSIREVGKYQNDYRYRETTIGDSGKVAYIAHVSPIEEVIQIGDHGGVDTVSSGGYAGFRPPAINEQNQVVFWSRNADTGESILLWDPSDGLSTVMDTEIDRPVKLGRPALNNQGTIAFTATLGDGTRELRTWNSGKSKKILDDSGDYLKFTRIEINDRGVIAFRSVRNDAALVILAVQDSELIEVKDLNLIHVKDTSRLAINNQGTIVFSARKSDDSWWLYTVDASEENSKPQPLASTTEPLAEHYELIQFRGDPGINSRGEVVFWADYKLIGGSGQKLGGLFALPGPDPLVLGTGAAEVPIGDETYQVHDLWSSGGINDKRMISFWFSEPPGGSNRSFVARAVPAR